MVKDKSPWETYARLATEEKECPIPCEECWKSNGEACFTKDCPKLKGEG